MTSASLLAWLAEASIVLGLAVLLILAARRLMRGRVSAGWIYALWVAVPAALLATLAPAVDLRAADAPAWLSGFELVLPQIDLGLDLASPIGGAAAPAGDAANAGFRLPLALIALILWLGGAIFFSAKQLWIEQQFHRAVVGTARRPEVREFADLREAASGTRLPVDRAFRFADVAAPMACGLFRPVVLLPADFLGRYAPDERRVVVVHEAEHLRSRHIAHRLAARLIRDLFWFHPLAWVGERTMTADQELACDEASLRHANSISPRTYAQTLLKAAAVAHGAWAPAASAPLTRASGLRERTLMIVKHAAIGRTRGAGALALAAVASVSVLAACAVTSEPEPAAVAPTRVISGGPVANALNGAIEALNAEDYVGAELAMSALDLDTLTPYERSRSEQILFQIDYATENYEAARAHLQAAVDAGGLDEDDAQAVRYQIAQTYMVEERWAEGATALEAWIQGAASPNGAAYYLLAVAYYQQKDFAKALPNVERAVELSESPQESWLQLVVALYIEQERWRDAAPVLERLNTMVPDNRAYWVQLAAVYRQLGMTAEHDALAARAPAEFLPLEGDSE